MGKTATIAMLAMKYVNGEEGMQKFDFVWTVRLKNVDKTSSLAEIVQQQHGKLKVFQPGQVQSILEGRTQSKVALLFDGYDEYQPGRNKAIDEAIQSGVGNCFLVLTSRPGYVGDHIRKKMDYEVTIEGLSVTNIEKCSKLYLETWEKSADMLKQAKTVGIYKPNDGLFQRIFFPSYMTDDAILRIPIMLLMTCFIYEEKQSLPKTRTGVLKTLYTLLGHRSRMKLSGRTTDEIDAHENTLSKLGQLAWDALKRDVLILKKVYNFVIVIFFRTALVLKSFYKFPAKLYFQGDVERECPDVLKWGVLQDVGEAGSDYVSFFHKLLQEFAVAWYICKTLENAMDKKVVLIIISMIKFNLVILNFVTTIRAKMLVVMNINRVEEKYRNVSFFS